MPQQPANLMMTQLAMETSRPHGSSVLETLPEAPPKPDTRPAPPEHKPDPEPFEPDWPVGRPEPQPKA